MGHSTIINGVLIVRNSQGTWVVLRYRQGTLSSGVPQSLIEGIRVGPEGRVTCSTNYLELFLNYFCQGVLSQKMSSYSPKLSE